MNILTLILGVIEIISFGVLLVCSIKRTPTNLKGYYGKFYKLFTVLGMLGGLVLVLFSF